MINTHARMPPLDNVIVDLVCLLLCLFVISSTRDLYSRQSYTFAAEVILYRSLLKVELQCVASLLCVTEHSSAWFVYIYLCHAAEGQHFSALVKLAGAIINALLCFGHGQYNDGLGPCVYSIDFHVWQLCMCCGFSSLFCSAMHGGICISFLGYRELTVLRLCCVGGKYFDGNKGVPLPVGDCAL